MKRFHKSRYPSMEMSEMGYENYQEWTIIRPDRETSHVISGNAMETVNQTPLEKGYYLKYFETILRDVLSRYSDLLNEEELRISSDFSSLCLNSKLLLVRLLTRKNSWLLVRSLKYEEINVPDAISDLTEAGFITDQSESQPVELLELLNKAELISIARKSGISISRDCLKPELAARLEEVITPAHLEEMEISAVRISRPEFFQLIYLLFFGNFEQTLTEFIIQDIGNVTYEKYRLCRETRLFSNRSEIDELVRLNELRQEFDIKETLEDRIQLAGTLMNHTDFEGLRTQVRFRKLMFDLGYFLEKNDRTDLALGCYKESGIPSSRERTARIFIKTGRLEEAAGLITDMLHHPLDHSESEFARKTAVRISRRTEIRVENKHLLEFREIPEVTEVIERNTGLSIEENVLNHLRANGKDGWHTENRLIRALFGLLFWDIIFSDQRGAFNHPFQRGPRDIRSPDFFDRRQELFQTRFGVLDQEYILRTVHDVWKDKFGLSNLFVSWNNIPFEAISHAAENIPAHQLIPVLKQLSRSPAGLDSGFPDLYVYDTLERTICFMEVKGPGDTLRPKQRFWLEKFNDSGIPACIARILWKS